jgi:hypothetical protein
MMVSPRWCSVSATCIGLARHQDYADQSSTNTQTTTPIGDHCGFVRNRWWSGVGNSRGRSDGGKERCRRAER